MPLDIFSSSLLLKYVVEIKILASVHYSSVHYSLAKRELNGHEDMGIKKDVAKKHLATSFKTLVGVPGLEPGKAGPESAVLPLHHTPIPCNTHDNPSLL